MNTLADRIQMLVDQAGSASTLSLKAGLSRTQVGMVLARLRKNPNSEVAVTTIQKIARGAGVSEKWLLSGPEAAPVAVPELPTAVGLPAPRASSPIVEAIDLAFDRAGRMHSFDDMRAVVAALGELHTFSADEDPVAVARAWLDAARDLRKKGMHPFPEILAEEYERRTTLPAPALGVPADNEAVPGSTSERPVAGTEGLPSERGDDAISGFRKLYVPVRDADGNIVGVTGGESTQPKMKPVGGKR